LTSGISDTDMKMWIEFNYLRVVVSSN